MEYLKRIPKRRQSKEIVLSIFQATTRLIQTQKNPHFSTNKVAQVAGVSVGSLYQYFKNKNSIFHGLLYNQLERHKREFRSFFESAEALPLDQFFDQLLDIFFDLLVENKNIKSTFFNYAPTEFYKSISSLEKFVQESIEYKLLKHTNEIQLKPRELSFILVYATLGVCRQAVKTNNTQELLELKKNLNNVYKESIYTKKYND